MKTKEKNHSKTGIKIFCGLVILITLASGINNMKFMEGSPDIEGMDIALSVLAYSSWLILSLYLIWKSEKPVNTSLNITLALIICFVMGLLMPGPLVIVFFCPFAVMEELLWNWQGYSVLHYGLFYLGIILFDWLCAVIKIKRKV